MESSDEQCPKCTESNVNLDKLIPNQYLRKECIEFDHKTAGRYVTLFQRRMQVKSPTPTPLPPHLRTSNISNPVPSFPLTIAHTKVASPDTKIIATNYDKSETKGTVIKDVKEFYESRSTRAPEYVGTSPKSEPMKDEIKYKPDESEQKGLYRVLLKDGEGNESASAPMKHSNKDDLLKFPTSTSHRGSVCTDSSSSDGSSKDEPILDTSLDLFSIALNTQPYHLSQSAAYPPCSNSYPSPPSHFQLPLPRYSVVGSNLSYHVPVIETTDDPLAAFEKHLREKDERRKQQRRHWSPSYVRSHPHQRSWSRSHYKNDKSLTRGYGGRRYRHSRSRSPPSAHQGHHYLSPRSRSRQYSSRSGRMHGSPSTRRSPYRRSPPGHYKDRRIMSRSRLVTLSLALLVFYCVQSVVLNATGLTFGLCLGYGDKLQQIPPSMIQLVPPVQSRQFFNEDAGFVGSSYLPPH